MNKYPNLVHLTTTFTMVVKAITKTFKVRRSEVTTEFILIQIVLLLQDKSDHDLQVEILYNINTMK